MAETRATNGTPTSWQRQNTDAAGNVTDRCTWNVAPGELCKAVGTAMSPEPALRSTTDYDARNQRISLRIPGRGETVYSALYDYAVVASYVPLRVVAGTVTHEHQTTYGYDTRHRLTSISQQACAVLAGSHTCTGTVTATGSTSYTYDDNDRRTVVTESPNGGPATTWRYCYDPLGRLVAADDDSGCTAGPPPTGDEVFSYDDAGNRTAAAGVSYSYSTAGQLTGCAPSCGTISHDATGRISAWNGWTLTYDGEGRLATACKVAGCASGDLVESVYDAEGRRIELRTRPAGGALTTRVIRYGGSAPVQELVGGTVVREYLTDEAGGIVTFCDPTCASGTHYVVVWNGHGDATSIRRVEPDGSLTLAATIRYTSWGTPTVTPENGIADLGFRYLYVGRHGVAWDDALGLGLHHMGARHYSPALGRFLQPDPIAAEANLYAYAESDPVDKVDPDGTLPAHKKGLTPHQIGVRAEQLVRKELERAGWRVTGTQVSHLDGARIVDIVATKGGATAVVEVKANGGYRNWFQRGLDHLLVKRLQRLLGVGRVASFEVRVRVSSTGRAVITKVRHTGGSLKIKLGIRLGGGGGRRK